ncbi:MAG: DUF1735 domain-containing protein [Gillisia sp.]
MKNIFKSIAFLILASVMLVSCSKEETNYASLINPVNLNSTYYVQFANASKSLETAVDENGGLVNIETTIDVVLLGPPQSQDVQVNLTLDPSSTIQSNMYNLSATSVTIPAGETSGSVTLTTNAENMPVGEPVSLIMNLDAGEHNATAGTSLHYDLKRIAFCPLEIGVADLVGSYGVTDNIDSYENDITVTQEGDHLLVSGIGVSFINGFWGEDVTSGGTFTMQAAGNGVITIPRQHLFTTVYDGAPYRYDIKGSGVWRNCGDQPQLEITYDIYYEGDAAGLAEQYASYLPTPYLSGVFTRK